MRSLLLLSLLATLPGRMSAQHITYSSDSSQPINAIIWHIVACSDKAAVIPTGLIFQHLQQHGAAPLSNTQILAVFQSEQKHSWEYKASAVAGGASMITAVLMTNDTIKASTQWKAGLTFAGGILGIGVPLLTKDIPALDPLQSSVIGSALVVPAGGCSSPDGIWLAAPMKSVPANFEVTLPN